MSIAVNRLYAIVTVFGLMSLGSKVLAQVVTSDPDKVLVRIEVDLNGTTPGSVKPAALARWSDTSRVLRVFEDVTWPLKLSTDPVPSATVLPGVIARNLTKTNPVAASRAIAMNRPSTAESPTGESAPLGATPLFVAPFGTARINPNVRTRAWSSQLSTYSRADDSTLRRLFAGPSIADEFRILVPDASDPSGGVPKRRAIQLELTRPELLELRRQNPMMLHRTLNGAFPVTLSAGGVVGAKPLTLAEMSAFDQVFREKRKLEAKPLLIIVDDSWPSDDEFLATKNLVGSTFPTLWKTNSDQASTVSPPDLPDAIKRLSSPGIPQGSGCTSLSACDTHSKRVQQAIEPLREYARTKLGEEPIDVIWFPLAASQKGSREILSMLWNLSYAAGTNIAPNSPTFAAEESTRKRQESEFLGSLQPTLPKGVFQSNWGIVDSVTHFARRYAQARQVPVYINFSWTTEDTSYNSPILTDWNLLVVAAAGNSCKNAECKDFADQSDPPRLFITRAERPIDVLLVVNLDENGNLTCGSTKIRTNYSVVGFDGAINGDCGTSFASPRVAWLLATRAALGGGPFAIREQVMRLKWVMSLGPRRKCAGDDDYKCVRLRLTDLLPMSSIRGQ